MGVIVLKRAAEMDSTAMSDDVLNLCYFIIKELHVKNKNETKVFLNTVIY